MEYVLGVHYNEKLEEFKSQFMVPGKNLKMGQDKEVRDWIQGAAYVTFFQGTGYWQEASNGIRRAVYTIHASAWRDQGEKDALGNTIYARHDSNLPLGTLPNGKETYWMTLILDDDCKTVRSFHPGLPGQATGRPRRRR